MWSIIYIVPLHWTDGAAVEAAERVPMISFYEGGNSSAKKR